MTTKDQADMTKIEADDFISPIHEIIDEARQGRMYILVDAPDRENEGDLVIPAQMATPDAVNFMAAYGRGLICLALEKAGADRLDLKFMTPANKSRNQTAFTVSIEAKEGITTGISAHDRAHTIATAIAPQTTKEDIVSPGHVFPLIARDGGVLVRAGHTEAAVDISRLAGLIPAGVICEIMNEDGTMARVKDLVLFAKKHGLKIGTIADLIAYRRAHDYFIDTVHKGQIDHELGVFDVSIYRSTLDGIEHLALTKGLNDNHSLGDQDAIPVRMHKINLLGDLLGGINSTQNSNEILQGLTYIAKQDKGAVILLNSASQNSFSSKFQIDEEPQENKMPDALIEYGIGAQILSNLGIRRLKLLTNSNMPKVVGLSGYDIEIVSVIPLKD